MQHVIPVDSIFSPITKVNYIVEDTRVGQRTDFDKLTLEVYTDGSIKPYEAISKAAAILQRKLSLFSQIEPPTREEEEPSGPESELLDTPIEDLQLSVRSLNCLKRAGIRTVGELLTYSEEDVMKLKNFGQKSLDEIADAGAVLVDTRHLPAKLGKAGTGNKADIADADHADIHALSSLCPMAAATRESAIGLLHKALV